ncbi:MAG: site-2 protease family protein [Candidatus Merdivicinus sp.]|jgi:Zn-dependent protease
MPTSIVSLLYRTVVRLIVLLTALPFHEFAHAWTANKLGDPTAKYQGRLTLNPLKHLDPMGAVLMLVAGFGWAKPVPVNPNYFKNRKAGMAITAMAGPLSNLLLAFVCTIVYKALYYTGFVSAGLLGEMLSSLASAFLLMVSLNVGLGVFNLIPIPPLDGSRILNLVLPERTYFQIMRYERIIMLALFAAIFIGLLDGPLSFVQGHVFRLLDFLTGFVDVIARAVL